MTRVILWGAGGIILGLIVHLIVILVLPQFSSDTIWARVVDLNAQSKVVVLDETITGESNALGLDPALVYAVCEFDLSQGPGVFNGDMPTDFWSIEVFDQQGVAVYGTTNRAGIGRSLTLGIFNPSQVRLLSDSDFEIAEGLLVVEAPSDALFALVRLAPPHPEMRSRYEKILLNLQCGHIDISETTFDS